jgi:putative tryptophan/tyrosine transport system substrate-binding protein
MRKKIFGLTLSAMLFALCFPAVAQQRAKVPHIGFLSAASPSAMSTRLAPFKQGLRELGYVEGKNISIESRYAEGKLDHLRELATELVRLKVAVMVSGGPAVTRPIKEVTSTIPIVMTQDSDPVGSGLVASLARPGGNVTGLSTLAPEISGKQLEILKEIVPRLSRLAVLGNSALAGNAQSLKETEQAAQTFGVQLQYLDVSSRKEIDSVFRAASKGRADAVLVLINPFMISHRALVVDLALKSRLPTIYSSPDSVEDGGLMSYSPSSTDLFRRAATYVDKVLKGTKPADLPVEQPMKFEFVINLKAAKQIGLTIPPNLLVRADRVIK